MELALEEILSCLVVVLVSVSILVIMELALEVVIPLKVFRRVLGFNPCYYGIGFRSYRFY